MNDVFVIFITAAICGFASVFTHSQTVSSIQTDCHAFGQFRIGEKVFECKEKK